MSHVHSSLKFKIAGLRKKIIEKSPSNVDKEQGETKETIEEMKKDENH